MDFKPPFVKEALPRRVGPKCAWGRPEFDGLTAVLDCLRVFPRAIIGRRPARVAIAEESLVTAIRRS
jgi:hypothetical protein